MLVLTTTCQNSFKRCSFAIVRWSTWAIKLKLDSASHISITVDTWTNINHDSFGAMTDHFIDNDSQIVSYLLECSEFSLSHTASNIEIWVKEILQSFYVHKKDFVVVTDNAANMKAAAHRQNFQHLPCSAHSLNLAFQHALQVRIKNNNRWSQIKCFTF